MPNVVVDDRLVVGERRIVDQNVDRAECVLGDFDQPLALFLSGDVDRDSNSRSAGLPDFRHRPRKRPGQEAMIAFVKGPCSADNARALLGEQSCDLLADAPAGAGYNGDAAIELAHAAFSLKT